jgi:hypothetical protein
LAEIWGDTPLPPSRGESLDRKERLKALLPFAVEDLRTIYTVLIELFPFYDDPQVLIDTAKVLGVNI